MDITGVERYLVNYDDGTINSFESQENLLRMVDKPYKPSVALTSSGPAKFRFRGAPVNNKYDVIKQKILNNAITYSIENVTVDFSNPAFKKEALKQLYIYIKNNPELRDLVEKDREIIEYFINCIKSISLDASVTVELKRDIRDLMPDKQRMIQDAIKYSTTNVGIEASNPKYKKIVYKKLYSYVNSNKELQLALEKDTQMMEYIIAQIKSISVDASFKINFD
jgi:hypothetical protein